MQTREQHASGGEVRRGPLTTVADAGWIWRRYQVKFLLDRSRLMVVVKSRQIGMSEAAAALAVKEAMDQPGRAIWLLSVNLASAKEVLRKCKVWATALSACDPAIPKVVQESTESMEFSNGARIMVLPCTAKAVRGKTGTVIIDEAAHVQNDRSIWTAIAPVIASNKSLRMILISTPFGARGVFYDAYHGHLDSPSMKWSKHFIDVDHAVADGFPRDVLDLRGSYTADGWAQEFKCSFVSQQGKYYPVGLITACHEAELPDDVERVVAKRALSIDCASKSDSAVSTVVDFDGDDTYRIHSPIVLSSKENPRNYAQQFDLIKRIVDADRESYDYIVVDANGVGAGLASFLKAEYGSCVIELIPTAPWKAKNIPALKVDMESKKVEIQPDPTLTLAFNSVRERRTAANTVVFDAPRDEHGHADGFSAALMGYAVLKVWPSEKVSPVRVASSRASKSARNQLRQY